MLVFGFFWLGWGCAYASSFPYTGWLVLYAAMAVLLTVAIRVLRKGTARMSKGTMTGASQWERNAKPFRVILKVEGAGCGLMFLLAIVFHQWNLLAAGISLVVGLHFLPLARLMRVPAYYWTGVAIVVCDVFCTAWFTSSAITVAVGAATGTIMWITGILLLVRSRKLI